MTYQEYKDTCEENGDIPCVDQAGHKWVVSDEDDNVCYCEKCGCSEY